MKDMVEENTHKKFILIFQDFMIKKTRAWSTTRSAWPTDGLRARDILQFYMKSSEFANELSAMASL